MTDRNPDPLPDDVAFEALVRLGQQTILDLGPVEEELLAAADVSDGDPTRILAKRLVTMAENGWGLTPVRYRWGPHRAWSLPPASGQQDPIEIWLRDDGEIFIISELPRIVATTVGFILFLVVSASTAGVLGGWALLIGLLVAVAAGAIAMGMKKKWTPGFGEISNLKMARYLSTIIAELVRDAETDRIAVRKNLRRAYSDRDLKPLDP